MDELPARLPRCAPDRGSWGGNTWQATQPGGTGGAAQCGGVSLPAAVNPATATSANRGAARLLSCLGAGRPGSRACCCRSLHSGSGQRRVACKSRHAIRWTGFRLPSVHNACRRTASKFGFEHPEAPRAIAVAQSGYASQEPRCARVWSWL